MKADEFTFENRKYVLLENIEDGGTFFMTYVPNVDPTIANGEVMYRIIGFASTRNEAQEKCYGQVLVEHEG